MRGNHNGDKKKESVGVELRCVLTILDGEPRMTEIWWDGSTRAPSTWLALPALKLTFCDCTMLRLRHVTRVTQRRCTWTIRYE